VKKKTVCLFLRKPIYGKNYSVEKYYYELIKNHYDRKFILKLKICPVLSKGLLRRVYLMFWAYFNQGDINHICGDINFISIFLKKTRTIVTVLDNYSLKRLKGFKKFVYYFFWLKIPLSRCSQIISISKSTTNELIKYFPKFKNKIIEIDVCIQKIFKKNIQKFNSLPFILIIGTSINKNFHNSISALFRIRCKVLIIGKLNKDKINLLNNLNINYKNFFNLNDLEVYKTYCQSDILLFPSTYEGFGMPILEAQAVGRPVITSNINPLTYVAGNGALFVNPYSIKSISKGVKIIIKNDFLRKKLIKNGFENIKRFNVKSILQQHYNCYNQILNNK
jgi:glycosyltransferase involved in cell wall biosynthesis